jgi:hypothetical protein
MKMAAPRVCFMPAGIFTAISTARRPKSVVNLITGSSETEDVPLKGSPTVSPTTVAASSGVKVFVDSGMSAPTTVPSDSAAVGFLSFLRPP